MNVKRTLISIISTLAVCACGTGNPDSEQLHNEKSIKSLNEDAFNALEAENQSIIHKSNSDLHITCFPKSNSGFSIHYRIFERESDVFIETFDASKNSYISDDIMFFIENEKRFEWLNNIDIMDIYDLSFSKSDDYYYVFSVTKSDTKSDAVEHAEKIYKRKLFSINRKTGEMSSPSYIVANCEQSANQLELENKF